MVNVTSEPLYVTVTQSLLFVTLLSIMVAIVLLAPFRIINMDLASSMSHFKLVADPTAAYTEDGSVV